MLRLPKTIVPLLASLVLMSCASNDEDGERMCMGTMSACQSGAVQIEPTTTGPNTQSAFYCKATPSKSAVNHDEVFSILFEVSGGTAPYSIPVEYHQYAGSGFESSQRLWGANLNTTSSDRVVVRTNPADTDPAKRPPIVRDATGKTAFCPFTVTVRSRTNPSNLKCEIAYGPQSPSPGTTVNFTFTASGGNGEYTFLNFRPQGYWQVPNTAIQRVSATESRASAIFTSAGNHNASVVVISGGHAAVCSKPISVTQTDVQLAAIPSNTVPLNGELTVQATSYGFPATPGVTYNYTTSEPEIGIINNGASARIINNDGRYHSFDVTVTATDSEGRRASRAIRLTFTPSATLSCALQGPTGTIFTNTTASFGAVHATGSTLSEALRITELYVDNVAQTITPGGTVSVTMTTAGARTVAARIVSANTNTPCNGGSLVTLSNVKVYRRLTSCNVDMLQQNGAVGQSLTAEASPGADVYHGVGPFEMVIPEPGDTGSPNAHLVGVLDPLWPHTTDTSTRRARHELTFIGGAQRTHTYWVKLKDLGDLDAGGNPRTVQCSNLYYVR